MQPPSIGPPPGFELFEVHREDRTIIVLQGELGDVTARELRRRLLGLLSLPLERVTIDLAEVTSVDRASLDVLTLACRVATDHSIDLVLEHVPADVRAALDAPAT